MNHPRRTPYKAVIGLEVHAQLSLKRKLFSPEVASYGALPNTQVSTVTLAHPGTLPRLNKKAMDQAIMLGLACAATITQENRFARKNYFYPDLPKGYQITQSDTPICQGGWITMDDDMGEEHKVALQRIHLEEDAGKSLHNLLPDETLLDFNRAGVALIEIVTEPVMHTAKEAYRFLTELRKLLRYLEICDGNMEEGSLRCDANISVMRQDATALGNRVEVKNMNSIRHVQLAIEHEIDRQIATIEAGKTVISETRAYDATTGHTTSQRNKETEGDYRYFTEPDLPPVFISEDWIEEVRAHMPLLPRDCFRKFVDLYGLSTYDARVLTESKAMALYFEEVCRFAPYYKAAANWVMGPVKSYLNLMGLAMHDFPITPQGLADLTTLVEKDQQVSFSVAVQQLFPILVKRPNESPIDLAKELDLIQQTNEALIQSLIEEVAAAYPDKVKAYKKGKKGLLGMLMGEIMKRSQGKVSPKLTNALLQQYLECP